MMKEIRKDSRIRNNQDRKNQRWEDFERAVTGKKLILIGAGARLGRYLKKYGDSCESACVIDNDEAKQGLLLDEIVPEAFGLKEGKKKISDISTIKSYDADEIVVLITIKNGYETIIAQLERFGIHHFFIQTIMEENARCRMEEKSTQKDDMAIRREYAEACCLHEPIHDKKIFFSAYADYTDHGKYITEALLKIRRDLDIVWVVYNLKTEVPPGVRKVYGRNWKRFIYEMETAKIWVLDLATPDYIIKRPQQLYLQTKHWASITLKKFYLDAKTFESVPEKIENWKRDGELIDYIVTGSDFDTDSCRRGFGFQKEALQYGSPRSDALFREKENRDKVYEYYHLAKERKSVIYAPTYRFDKVRGKNVHESRNIELDFWTVKNALEKRFGGEWHILMRLHPSVAMALKDVKMPEFVTDVSSYGDSQELVSAADIMISDFSSIMFEPAFVKKPVFLFATDLQDYLENEYELLIPYEELPFPIAEANEELAERILEFDLEIYRKNVEAFLERYGVHEDGRASERVAAFISEYIS